MRCAMMVGAVLMAAVAGCGGYSGETGVTVTGKVLKGGSPLPIPSEESGGYVTIQLQPRSARPDGSPGDAAGGVYKPDGTVTFVYAGKGIAPGKYQLVAEVNDGAEDTFQGKYGAEQSKIEIVVPEDQVGGTYDFGTIDLDKPPAPASP